MGNAFCPRVEFPNYERGKGEKGKKGMAAHGGWPPAKRSLQGRGKRKIRNPGKLESRGRGGRGEGNRLSFSLLTESGREKKRKKKKRENREAQPAEEFIKSENCRSETNGSFHTFLPGWRQKEKKGGREATPAQTSWDQDASEEKKKKKRTSPAIPISNFFKGSQPRAPP